LQTTEYVEDLDKSDIFSNNKSEITCPKNEIGRSTDFKLKLNLTVKKQMN